MNNVQLLSAKIAGECAQNAIYLHTGSTRDFF